MAMSIGFIDDGSEVGDYMHAVVDKFYRDCLPYTKMPLPDFYRLVKNLPYNMEGGLYQSLVRPGLALNGQFPIVACVNKSIIMSSYLKCKNTPYRYKIVAKNPLDALHHVYTEGYIGRTWIPLDCTYPENRIGVTENWGKVVVK